MKKILLGMLALVVVIIGGFGAFVASKPSLRPASTEKVEATPERAARGKYLAESLLSCMHCHTKPNPTRWGSLGDLERRGAGGLCWNADMGFPGTVCSRNITPDPETGIGSWTDGEIMRAIREGVRRDGTPLFPIMGYLEYRNCHSPVDDKHERIPGKEFSGGQEFKFMGLAVKSANLTPHETGLGEKTKENFIGQFHSFSTPELWDMKVEPSKNTIMPWLTLSHLTDEDLGAIFAFLKSLPPIANSVEKYPHPEVPAAAAAPTDARSAD